MEPIYLQSRNNDLPTLVRVVVTDGRTFVMERNLQQALAELVSRKGKATTTAPLPNGAPLPNPAPLPDQAAPVKP